MKYEVHKLTKSGMVSFENRAPNVKTNQLPAHSNAFVNMVDGCPGNLKVFDRLRIRRSLVEMHRDFSWYVIVNINMMVVLFAASILKDV